MYINFSVNCTNLPLHPGWCSLERKGERKNKTRNNCFRDVSTGKFCRDFPWMAGCYKEIVHILISNLINVEKKILSFVLVSEVAFLEWFLLQHLCTLASLYIYRKGYSMLGYHISCSIILTWIHGQVFFFYNFCFWTTKEEVFNP